MIQRLKGGGDTPARQRFNNKDSTTSSTPITMAPPRCLTQKCQQNLVAQSLPADPAPKWEIAGHHRRKDSPQCICEPDLGIHPPASSALLIPAVLRPNGRYVNRFIRGLPALTRSQHSSSSFPARQLPTPTPSPAGNRRPDLAATPATVSDRAGAAPSRPADSCSTPPA